MAIIYNSLYRWVNNGELQVMPAPVDPATPDALWQVDRARNMAAELAAAGVTHYLLPPITMAQGGSAPNSDGYGKEYDYNIGQWPDRPTRWGPLELLMRAVGALNAHGIVVMEDSVIHQMDGGEAQHYPEIGADGKRGSGRDAKTPTCFSPAEPQDPVFDPAGNVAFGDRVTFLHCQPAGYMLEVVLRATTWRWQRAGLGGMRQDDTKGENIAVTNDILNAPVLRDGFNFGECFVGSVSELQRWIAESGGKRTLDFPLHWALQAVCDFGASFRLLDGAGLAAVAPLQAITFVDTADTDLNDGENIKFNKLWAYAFILLTEGSPAIYAGDYERYGLSKEISNLAWISSMFAIGSTRTEYVDDGFIVLSRDGNGGKFGWSGGLLFALNRDPVNPRGEWVLGPFGPNALIHDYSGTMGDLRTNEFGWVYIEAPPNRNGSGRSYVAYAMAGVDKSIAKKPILTTQRFVSDGDSLDIPFATTGVMRMPERIYAAKNQRIQIGLTADNLPINGVLVATVNAEDGSAVSWRRVGAGPGNYFGLVPATGWHTISIEGFMLPAEGVDFDLAVTYEGA
jgi:alpha-amylase